MSTFPWEIELQFQTEARTITLDAIPAFLQKLSIAYPSTFFPAKIVQELIHNPNLPLEKVLPSTVSPALYKSTLEHLDAVLAPIDVTKTTKDIHHIFQVLVSDPTFFFH